MKLYEKIIDGVMHCKPASRIVLIKDDMQIFNPTEEMLLEEGWIEHVSTLDPEPTEKDLLEEAKLNKILELEDYDSSSEVNICYITLGDFEMPYWADKTERSSLKTAVQNCISLGRELYRLDLRDKGVSMNISCEALLQMLAALEVYAVDCYNKTTDHIFAIKALETIEEVEAYDFTIGYPEKLRFNIG